VGKRKVVSTPPPPGRRLGFPPVARLAIFTVRHLIGLAVFGWVTKASRDADPESNLWLAVAGLLAAYFVAVVVGAWQLWGAVRRQQRGRR